MKRRDETVTDRPQAHERCAYLGRVSSPKQKLEHQRESVMHFAASNGLQLPPERWFEDKVRRHKQLAEGQNFNRLLGLAKAGEIDWILIATFDRWGITDKDDIFVFRKELRSWMFGSGAWQTNWRSPAATTPHFGGLRRGRRRRRATSANKLRRTSRR